LQRQSLLQGHSLRRGYARAPLHAADDPSVVVENSLSMYRALRSAGVTTDLHLYAAGGHGFGLRYANDQPVGYWPMLVKRWIEAQVFSANVAE
jgi:acetyl esterase/lipase